MMASSRSSSSQPTNGTGTISVKVIFINAIIIYACVITATVVFQAHPQIDHHADVSAAVETRHLLKNEPSSSSSLPGWNPLDPLAIAAGKAQNLPSIRVQDTTVDVNRKFYGGNGDKPHLGGFTEMDLAGISPAVWKHMLTQYGVHSVLDVGCGRGISTLWFYTHGADILCVEGSHDAVERTVLPDPENQIVEHDFARGPWWPEKTYDAVWAVEFLEHVNLHFQFNYLTAFRKAALLFVTSSRHGGWHHTEVHMDDWWIQKYEAYGFRYSEKLTKEVRDVASKERNGEGLAPDGRKFDAQHVWLSMKVFINPSVAALPNHAHLFPEFGCYDGRKDGQIVHRECGTGKDGKLETPLEKSFYPIQLTEGMDTEWNQMIRSRLNLMAIV